MGHLLKQAYCTDRLKISELDISELALVYTSAFNNLPWQIPLCIEYSFSEPFKVRDKFLDIRERRIDQQCLRTNYEYGDDTSNILDFGVYEIDNNSSERILLSLINQSESKPQLNKIFLERLFETLPSKNWVESSVKAVSPYEGFRADFELNFHQSVVIDTDDLFIFKQDLFEYTKKLIIELKKLRREEKGDYLEDLRNELAEEMQPNSLDSINFPVAEALITFVLEKDRLPYQNTADRKVIWDYIKSAAYPYKEQGRNDKSSLKYDHSGDGVLKVLDRYDVFTDIKKVYYSKLLSALAKLDLPPI